MNDHVLDAHDGVQMPVKPQGFANVNGVGPWRVGQQDANAVEVLESVHHAGVSMCLCLERAKLMRLSQKLVWIHGVVFDQAEQGGTVTLPIVSAQLAGLHRVKPKLVRDVNGHLPVDLWQNLVRGHVQGVVQVEQVYLGGQTCPGVPKVLDFQNTKPELKQKGTRIQ